MERRATRTEDHSLRVFGKTEEIMQGTTEDKFEKILKVGSPSVPGGAWATAGGLLRTRGAVDGPELPSGNPSDKSFWRPFWRTGLAEQVVKSAPGLPSARPWPGSIAIITTESIGE